MTATISQALTEIALILKEGFAGTVIVPNDERDPPTDVNKVWARLRLEHTGRAQGSLSNANGKRRWASDGIGTVELSFPYGKGVKEPYNIAEQVVHLYEGKRTASDVWFRNVRVVEVPVLTNVTSFFRLDVVFEFQYDSIN